MSYREALQWFEYRRKHGGIGYARIAYLLACLATMTNNAHGGKATLHDFMPALPAPPEIVDEDGTAFMALFER